MAGTYTVTVTSGAQTGTISIAVTQPNQLIVTATSVGTTPSGSTGSATATASGGTSAYSYLWSNAATTATTTGLPVGTYTATVTDANGCSATASTAVGISLCTTYTSTDVPKSISATGNNIVVTSLLNIPSAATITDVNVLNLNIAHTYTSDLVIKLKSPTNTEITLLNAICGTNDNIALNLDDESSIGYISIPCPAIGNGTYQPYAALSGFDGQNTPGDWIMTVYDNFDIDGGSLNSWSLEVCYAQATPLAATATATDVLCNASATGTASATATGGIGGYTYLWSNGATTPNISNLTAGVYTVSVASGGELAAASVTITEPTALIVTAVANTNTATASATGGTSPLSYLWSNGSTSNTISNLANGDYTVTATDANGCTSATSVTILVIVPLSAAVAGTNLTCNGSANGMAGVTAANGVGGYTYLWSNGATTPNIFGLAAGTYTVSVVSGAEMLVSSVTLTQPAAINVTTSGTNATTTSGTGSASATASGGVSPYTYLWSNGGTTASITGVAIGLYTVTVTGANGCTKTATRIVSGPAMTVTITRTNNTCFGGTSGTATATSTGGNGVYAFVWSNGATTAAITGLAAGTYTVTVTSAAQSSTKATTITQPLQYAVTATPTNTTCGLNNGKVTLAAVNGTSATYLWSTGSTASSISSLAAGTYSVTVTSTVGCVATSSAAISGSTTLNVALTAVQPSGASNGSITATPTGGISPYTYLWNSTFGTTQTISNLAGGTYTVTVTATGGCTKTATTQLYCVISGVTSAEWIKRVVFSSTDNTSGNNNGFGDYTALPAANVTRGMSTAATLTAGYAATVYVEKWRIWVDNNNDGDFGDTGELLTSASGSNVVGTTFIVPTTAPYGTHRLRIGMRRTSFPVVCGAITQGEGEDYLINVVAPAALIGQPTGNTVTATPIGKLELAPNPANDVCNATFEAPETGKYTLTILDLSGRILRTQEIDATSGINILPINIQNIGSGMFTISIARGDFRITKSLIVNQ